MVILLGFNILHWYHFHLWWPCIYLSALFLRRVINRLEMIKHCNFSFHFDFKFFARDWWLKFSMFWVRADYLGVQIIDHFNLFIFCLNVLFFWRIVIWFDCRSILSWWLNNYKLLLNMFATSCAWLVIKEYLLVWAQTWGWLIALNIPHFVLYSLVKTPFVRT